MFARKTWVRVIDMTPSSYSQQGTFCLTCSSRSLIVCAEFSTTEDFESRIPTDAKLPTQFAVGGTVYLGQRDTGVIGE